MSAEAIRTAKARAGNRKAAVEKPRKFGVIVRDLLIERGMTTGIGNPNWSGLAAQLPDIQYETLRKAASGERWPSAKVMEAVAAVLGVEPQTFWEYQLWQVQRQFDPREVGEEAALEALRRWSAQGK